MRIKLSTFRDYEAQTFYNICLSMQCVATERKVQKELARKVKCYFEESWGLFNIQTGTKSPWQKNEELLEIKKLQPRLLGNLVSCFGN